MNLKGRIQKLESGKPGPEPRPVPVVWKKDDGYRWNDKHYDSIEEIEAVCSEPPEMVVIISTVSGRVEPQADGDE